jgi:hypothetical protein
MHFAELARKHSSQIYKGSLGMLPKREDAADDRGQITNFNLAGRGRCYRCCACLRCRA